MAMRTWFITGVSSGWGREMTRQLLARGERVNIPAYDVSPARQAIR
jgi:NAD(P)-dependent dehydrogenase (short-subunit alcohol dehydrogenase family)